MSVSGVADDIHATVHMRLRRRILEEGYEPGPEDIRKEVKRAIAFLEADDVNVDEMVAILERSFQTIIGTERTLVDSDETYRPWLDDRRADIGWSFWRRYEQYLLQKAWDPATLRRLSESTDHVLGLLNDPLQEGEWDRRGMIVGNVQSGKTGHYTGLICKAADAGYRVIIVLSGFHKSLRSQTQIRLEEGFLGFTMKRGSGSGPRTRVGVGLVDAVPDEPKADCITTREDGGDFRRQVADQFGIHPGGLPLLFVIKKNASVLLNLLKWVDSTANRKDREGRPYVVNVPVLVIDDEPKPWP